MGIDGAARARVVRAVVLVGALAGANVQAQNTAPVLDLSTPTLTTYTAGKTAQGQYSPRFDQRGVDLDGTLRAPMVLGWGIAADTLGGGVSSGRMLGDVNLFTGAWAPTDVDLALPTLGLPVVIGRSYNSVGVFSASAHDNDGRQGFNWGQLALPEIKVTASGGGSNGSVYLVYGPDRYIEFERLTTSSAEYKAKNGAAGVIEYADNSTSPDTYTYYDNRGNVIVFFGFDGASGNGAGQLWTMSDATGSATMAYVGHATSSTSAVSSGYSAEGVTTMYDGSGRRYTFAYSGSTIGGSKRLISVTAAVNSGGWNTVGLVEYSYYDGVTGGGALPDAAHGLAGDLRTATITIPDSVSGNQVMRKYYRYYTQAWDNSAGRKGSPHALKLVVAPEGTRRADLVGDSTVDNDFYSMSDGDLDNFAEGSFEYVSGSDRRLSKAILNGACGCAGGSGVTYEFTYGDETGYATGLGDGKYEESWARRTVIQQPDGNYVTQHFDEVGQVLARVLTNGAPGGSPTKKWITDVLRSDTAGQEGVVVSVHTPENITAYTHSSGSITQSTSVGMVTVFDRHSGSGAANLKGLKIGTKVKKGTSGSATTLNALTISERQLVPVGGGSSGVSIPVVATTAVYPAGSAETTTITTTFWSSTSSSAKYLRPMIVQTAAPAVGTGQNGSNSATSTYRYLREDGSTAYTKDATDVMFYSGRSAYGQTSVSIADVDTGITADILAGDAASGWSVASSGTEIHAKSTYTYDAQGRMTEAQTPGVTATLVHKTEYRALADGLMETLSSRYASSKYVGPISYNRSNQGGKTEASAVIRITTSGGVSSLPNTATTASPTADWQRVNVTVYDDPGVRVTEARMYHTIPGSGWGTSGTNYDVSTVEYDSMGRREKTTDATGTISKSVFDERGFVTESKIGTVDGGGSDNMTTVERREYDGAASGGGLNGRLTKVQRDEDGNWGTSTDTRTTEMVYDYRGRAIVTINPVAPHVVTSYDDLNRPTATSQYSASGGLSASSVPSDDADRIGHAETFYDQRGQVYQSILHEVVQADGSLDESITTNHWYDANGRRLKTTGASISKSAYDRLGRSTVQWVLAKTDDTTYANAEGVGGDVVLEESRTGYHPASGKVLLTHRVSRHHDYGLTAGALDSNADGDALIVTATDLVGRAQITAMWYDGWDRLEDTVQVGTNGGSTFTRTGLSVPSRSDTALRTTMTYDGWGQVYETCDPAGVYARTEFDAAGRRVKSIGNYVDGTAGGGTLGDEDQVTEYVYSAGRVTSMTRKFPPPGGGGSDDQTTTYTYGVVKTGTYPSKIASNRLLSTTLHPEQTGGQSSADRTAETAYNTLGEVITSKDPAGNVIATEYDRAGRVTLRDITTLGSGFDGTVDRIETTYTARGQVETVLQKNSGATVLDEVEFAYDDWGNVITVNQDPDSAVGAATGRGEFIQTFSYEKNAAAGGWQNMRLNDYASSGNVLVIMGYGTSGGVNDLIGRIESMEDGAYTALGTYNYLGAGMTVGLELPEPDVSTKLYGGGGSADYGTYMDRFNRPIKHQWKRTVTGGGSTTPVYIDLEMAHDRVSNMTAVRDTVLLDGSGTPVPQFGTLSVYDAMRRLYSVGEGEVNSGLNTLTTKTRAQIMDRNTRGRVTRDRVTLNGDVDYTDGPLDSTTFGEMDDTRDYNKRSELRTRTVYDSANPSTPKTVTLDYDKNGNLIDDGEKYLYKYNPWCQLVEVKNRTSPYAVQVNYRYNGLGQRITEQYDTNASGNTGIPDGVVDGNDAVFAMMVDMQGRRIGTARGTDSWLKEIFIHHPAHVRGPGITGGVLLRDRDVQLGDETKWGNSAAADELLERMYFSSDCRGNVVALMTPAGALVEQYRYSPTGVPFGLPAGDIDADGEVEGGTGENDKVLAAAIKAGSYQVRADVNLDGYVDATDETKVGAEDGAKTARGKLSIGKAGNRLGWRGMEWVGGVGAYATIRSHLDATTGRSVIAATVGCSSRSLAGYEPLLPEPSDDDCAARLMRECGGDPYFQLAMNYLREQCPGAALCPVWTLTCTIDDGYDASTLASQCLISIPVDIDGKPRGGCGRIAHEIVHAGDFCGHGCLTKPGFVKPSQGLPVYIPPDFFGDPKTRTIDCESFFCSEVRANFVDCCANPSQIHQPDTPLECLERRLQSYRARFAAHPHCAGLNLDNVYNACLPFGGDCEELRRKGLPNGPTPSNRAPRVLPRPNCTHP